MIRSILSLVILAVLSACSDTYNYYYEVVDTGSEADTANDDTANDDTANDDTSTDDTGAHECVFTVHTVNGEVEMENELVVSLNSASPSGPSVPGFIEVLRVDFRVVDPECPSLTLESFDIRGYFTDNAYALWTPGNYEIVDITEGSTVARGMFNIDDHTVTAALNVNVIMVGGSTHTMAVYADMSGASSREDDAARFDIEANSLTVSDSVDTYILDHEDVTGNTLVF